MDESERLMFEGWAKLPQFECRVRKAKDFAKQAFEISERPYLSISGGKDSVATAIIVNNVATQLNRDFILWAHVSDASFPGTTETIQAIATKINRKLILSESSVSAFDVLKARNAVKAFGKSGYFFDAIREAVAAHEFDLAFVGVRASESARRKKAVKALGSLFRSEHTNQWVCYPLSWFHVNDVFALILREDFPLHPIYFKRHPSGDCRHIRLGYLTAQDLMHRGTLAFIRDNYLEQYQKIIQARPEFSVYA